ncbi:MAG: hypothetical protein ACI9IV_001811 [Paracoccaceae bacterium]|jgi:hypothetical protein
MKRITLMFKMFTASALCAALALTSTTSTAQAQSSQDDLARLLFGVAALAIIAKSIDSKKDSNRSYRQAPVVTPRHYNNRDTRQNTRKNTSSVPASCERNVRTDRGTRTVFSVPCLNRAGVQARLPQKCLVDLQQRNRTVDAYAKRCLIRNGVRIQG